MIEVTRKDKTGEVDLQQWFTNKMVYHKAYEHKFMFHWENIVEFSYL